MSTEPQQAARYARQRGRRWYLPTSHYVLTRAAAIVAALGCGVSAGFVRAAVGAEHQRVQIVRMVGDATGFRFEPDRLEIASGDTLVFEVASGQPHDVAFDTVGVAPTVVRQLSRRLHDQIAPLAGRLLVKPGERYVVSFADVAPGRYSFYCLPHQALQMKGEVVVR